MQKFCHNCGKQLVPDDKFCGKCGTSLSSLSNKPAPPTITPGQTRGASQFTPFVVGRDEDDDDDSYLDRLEVAPIRQHELHVEIIKDRPLGESVGALVAQALQSQGAPTVDPARPAQYANTQAYLDEFKKEAGSLRRETPK
jgi:hypothetical protein